MIINTNMASLNTLRQLGANEKSTRSSLEKLSSGFRINSAADDAAGLAISEKMRGQISGLNKASSNAQDGISMVSTAEGSLNETTSILQRMRELAVQGSNDTNTTSDRTAIQTEMNQLTSEINRIGNTTEFNTQKLLKGKDLAVTTTAAAGTTLAQGEAGVAQGVISNYKLNASSVVGSASSTTVQASSKDTVGKISSVVAQTQASVKGVKSTVTLTNGISFQSDSAANAYTGADGLQVEIKQAATGGGAAATTMTQVGGSGTKITITIGTDASGNSLATNRGTLFNELDTAVKGFTFGGTDKFSVVAPQSTNSVVTDVRASGTFSGGKDEIKGNYNFDLTNPFGEAGDTITIAGKTFTGVTGTTVADPTKRQFQIDTAGSKLTASAAATYDLTTVVTDTSTKIVISVDNKDYTIDNTALDVDTANAAGLKTLIENAKAADGTLLSSVATVGGASTLSIASNSNGRVKFDIQSNSGGDITALETALKITDGQTDNMKDLQAASLLSAINADADISAHYTVTNTNNKLSFVENAGTATGVALQKPTIAGAGTNDFLTISNGDGRNLTSVSIVQSPTVAQLAAKAATNDNVDTSFQLTASDNGTELNGLKVSFASLTSGGTGVLTSTWDAANDTLNVTGDLGALAGASTLSAAIQSAVSSGLSAAGFQTAGALTKADGASTIAASLASQFNGKTLTFGDADNGGTLGKIAIAANNDAVTVSADSKGDLTIYLAATTASNNTAAKIQQAIQDLQKTQSSAAGDFTKFTAKAGGNWDTATLGNFITTATSTMVGGKVDVKGNYSFDVSTAFKAGDIAEVAGQKFKAVASGADATKGEFNVLAGDMYAQAAGIADAISLNTTLNKYAVTVDGFKINLTEKVATGSDLKATDLVVKAIGTAGQFSVDTGAINGNGGSFTIDGTVIKVSNKEANVGYANGTAIKVAATTADQTQALADAINKNATLSKKYTASVGTDGTLLLNQNEGEETATAPDVQVKTAPVGDFEAKLQIGANSGQTMTVTVSDMRSAALGISGDGSESTVAAKNGAVASYVATANVSNGTDNTNVEFSLDLSTADKATAAISVIDDATAAVSAARANLGAIQNRLEHTINNLGTSSQNITTAEANIRDVDMAKEMTNFQKNNILQQAAQAMLAQANQQPQGVLQLLR